MDLSNFSKENLDSIENKHDLEKVLKKLESEIEADVCKEYAKRLSSIISELNRHGHMLYPDMIEISDEYYHDVTLEGRTEKPGLSISLLPTVAVTHIPAVILQVFA